MGHDLIWCEKCLAYVYFDGHPEAHWDTTKPAKSSDSKPCPDCNDSRVMLSPSDPIWMNKMVPCARCTKRREQ